MLSVIPAHFRLHQSCCSPHPPNVIPQQHPHNDDILRKFTWHTQAPLISTICPHRRLPPPWQIGPWGAACFHFVPKALCKHFALTLLSHLPWWTSPFVLLTPNISCLSHSAGSAMTYPCKMPTFSACEVLLPHYGKVISIHIHKKGLMAVSPNTWPPSSHLRRCTSLTHSLLAASFTFFIIPILCSCAY